MSFKGGASYVEDSTRFGVGDAIFLNNTSGTSGGALEGVGSNLSWDSDALFANNIAIDGNGGALNVSSSTVSWRASASFLGNIAGSNGCSVHHGWGKSVTGAGHRVHLQPRLRRSWSSLRV